LIADNVSIKKFLYNILILMIKDIVIAVGEAACVGDRDGLPSLM
jgi:hypothetical protein